MYMPPAIWQRIHALSYQERFGNIYAQAGCSSSQSSPVMVATRGRGDQASEYTSVAQLRPDMMDNNLRVKVPRYSEL